ncbi:long-chain-fatty-acid--CoA ligase [Salinibaculum salinum]|uniref:long-chain-fatty-acid--CoA ligase n=1 Tax=Salinibaculum salinum TaxID=3131996 RepID=UPI0030ED28BE
MKKPLLATEFLDRARENFGEHEAVLTVEGDRLTYDELGDRVDRLSAALQDHGIEKGDRVAVLDPNTHYHLETAYAAIQIGAVHTPLNYRLKPGENEYIINDAGIDAIVCDYDFVDNVDPVREAVDVETYICTDPEQADTDEEWADYESVIDGYDTGEYERPEMAEDEIVTINYTSGTTGDPKGVMRTHRTETIHAYLTAQQNSIASDDVYYWTLPMFHVNGWGHIFAITGVGARHICARGFDPERTFEKITEEDVSYMCCAPTVMNMLIEHWEEHDPQTTGDNDLRIASGGAAPPEATMRTLEDKIGWYFKHMYGSTETGPLIVTSDYNRLFDQDDDSRFEIKNRQGFAMLGTEIDVVDEDGNSVPQDDETIGEIVVRGNQIMEGYWNKPEETEEAFSARREGWFHTGDLATLNEDGMLKIKDRKKDIIVSGGENISSLQLEDCLYNHPAVREVAIIPVPSEEWGETPKAYIIPKNGDPENPGVTAEEITAYTKEHLADYKAVRVVEFVDQLPKTSTGKIQKYELRQTEWDGHDQMVGEG